MAITKPAARIATLALVAAILLAASPGVVAQQPAPFASGGNVIAKLVGVPDVAVFTRARRGAGTSDAAQRSRTSEFSDISGAESGEIASHRLAA